MSSREGIQWMVSCTYAKKMLLFWIFWLILYCFLVRDQRVSQQPYCMPSPDPVFWERTFSFPSHQVFLVVNCHVFCLFAVRGSAQGWTLLTPQHTHCRSCTQTTTMTLLTVGLTTQRKMLACPFPRCQCGLN